MIIKKVKFNAGFTYVELIVVLSIFAIMSSIAIFNYGKFQAKVDIKNLANDIASRIVQAQKEAMSGKWNLNAGANWKPSYGLNFNISTLGNNNFVYFVNLNNDGQSDNDSCPISGGSGECLEKFNITKGNYVKLGYFDMSGTSYKINNLDIIFTRPNSGARIYSSAGELTGSISYARITIVSQDGLTKANIDVYPSGRVQIN